MNKDDLAVLWQNDVRPSRQVLAMKSEAVPHGVKHAPDSEFRACVFAFDRLHDAAALFRAARVHEINVGTRASERKVSGAAAPDWVQRLCVDGIQPADGWSGVQWGRNAPWSMGWFQGRAAMKCSLPGLHEMVVGVSGVAQNVPLIGDRTASRLCMVRCRWRGTSPSPASGFRGRDSPRSC